MKLHLLLEYSNQTMGRSIMRKYKSLRLNTVALSGHSSIRTFLLFISSLFANRFVISVPLSDILKILHKCIPIKGAVSKKG